MHIDVILFCYIGYTVLNNKIDIIYISCFLCSMFGSKRRYILLLECTYHLQYIYICKVDIWNVNCARATKFIFDTPTDVLVKVGQFLRQKMSWPEGEPPTFGFMPNALTNWAIELSYISGNVPFERESFMMHNKESTICSPAILTSLRSNPKIAIPVLSEKEIKSSMRSLRWTSKIFNVYILPL